MNLVLKDTAITTVHEAYMYGLCNLLSGGKSTDATVTLNHVFMLISFTTVLTISDIDTTRFLPECINIL